jgi:GcrA cell cycle regulator
MTVWTDELADLAASLWNDGKSASEIARLLPVSVTRSAVIGVIHRRGLSKRAKLTRELRAKQARAYTPPRPKAALKVFGNNCVMEEASPSPRPQIVIDAEQAFAPLPGSAPQPWIDRPAQGCAWPIGEALCCCEPVVDYGWCEAHVQLGRVPIKPQQKNLERTILRWAAL